MIIPEIKKMSTVEHLQAMEELWDALCHEEPSAAFGRNQKGDF
jgi:hypothetical protein